MATAMTMPALGLTTKSGTIVQWLRREGEQVNAGEPLCSVETDKTLIDIEAPASGTLLKIVRLPGEEVPVTGVMAYIGQAGEPLPEVQPTVKVIEPQVAPVPQPAAPEQGLAPARLRASPAARKLAEELGVNLEQVRGTGPGGRITREDVQQAAAPPAAAPATGLLVREKIPLAGKRKIAAQRLAQSKTTAPHFYLHTDIDMTRAVELRQGLVAQAEREGLPRVSYNDLFIKAAAVALGDFPLVNASLEADTIVCYQDINIGFAVALDDGLVVPVIRNADSKPVFAIAQETKALEAKAKSRGLVLDDLKDGTFTISNLGMYDVDQFIAIINPPQLAIVAIGCITKRVVVLDDQVAIRPILSVTLSADHRVIDGALAARFLKRFKDLLEAPEEL